jgi:hypothetical protein
VIFLLDNKIRTVSDVDLSIKQIPMLGAIPKNLDA